MIRIAEVLLDTLDEIGAIELDFKTLVLGERRIGSYPLDPRKWTAGPPPNQRSVRGSLPQIFRHIDSPYMGGAATPMGGAIFAGISAGRTPQPRQRVQVPKRWEETPAEFNTRISARLSRP